MSDEKQTDREQEREPEDVAQDLDLPDESAEQVKGGQQTPQKLAGQKL